MHIQQIYIYIYIEREVAFQNENGYVRRCHGRDQPATTTTIAVIATATIARLPLLEVCRAMCVNYSDFHVGKVFEVRVNNEKENNNTQTKRKTVIDSYSNFRPARIISELMSWRFCNNSLHALTGFKQLAGGFIFSPPFRVMLLDLKSSPLYSSMSHIRFPMICDIPDRWTASLRP